MGTFTTYIEDANDIEIEVKVYYDYQPAEVATPYYPGCDADVNITQVNAKIDVKWIAYDPTDDQREKFEQEAWDDMKALASAMEDY